MSDDIESVKQHYTDVLREIIDGADTLYKTTPATKITRDLMRMEQETVTKQIKHLVTFLSQVYAQVQEITIEEK